MKNDDNIQMIINIAGERIALTVPFSQQNHVRDTERNIGELYNKWRAKFPRKTMTELLAMMTYQYASYYTSLSEIYDKATDSAVEIDDLLSQTLNPGKSNIAPA